MDKSKVVLSENFSLISKYFICLYVLNISDLIFTRFLLKSAPNIFIEANIFLRPIVESWQIYFIKVIGLAIILLYWYKRSRKSTERQLRRSLLASRVLLIAYGLINCLHLFNLIILRIVSF